MHGPDKEFYDKLVSTMTSGVVGRGQETQEGSNSGGDTGSGFHPASTIHRPLHRPARAGRHSTAIARLPAR